MARLLLAALCLAALPAAAFDLDKFTDKLIQREEASHRKDMLQAVRSGRDPAERVKAVEWLAGSQSDPEAIAAIAGALKDSDAKVRFAAASGLWKHEKRAEPHRAELVAALDDADPDVVARAAGALQSIGMKEAELVAPRKRVLESPQASESSRFLVARNLVGFEPPLSLLPAMLAYLERNAARDPRGQNVELAERALERMVKVSKERALAAPLMEALATTKSAQIPLMKTLAAFEPRPENLVEALLAQLDAREPRVRYAALSHLGRVKGEREVAAWLPRAAALLQDPDSSVRSEALWVMGNAGGLAAGEADKVVAMLADPSAGVRRNAARTLGEIGEANQAIPAAAKARVHGLAHPALTNAMERDGDKDVREEARSALKKLGSGSAVLAAAAPGSTAASGNESAGMAVLRARKVNFETSSFYRALSEVDVELVRAFLDAGMSPREPVTEMGPPLRVMLFHGRSCSAAVRPTRPETFAAVKLLLERGADVNGADANGNTPLSEAAGKGCDRELIRLLIKAGAKVNAVNAAGLTPFEMGLWMGHDGLEELIAAGYRLPPEKVKAYTEGYKDRPAAQAMIKKAARK